MHREWLTSTRPRTCHRTARPCVDELSRHDDFRAFSWEESAYGSRRGLRYDDRGLLLLFLAAVVVFGGGHGAELNVKAKRLRVTRVLS